MTAWYDVKTHNEVINMKFFSKITNSVGTAGLTGLDRLFSFMIVTELQVCDLNCCVSFHLLTEEFFVVVLDIYKNGMQICIICPILDITIFP